MQACVECYESIDFLVSEIGCTTSDQPPFEMQDQHLWSRYRTICFAMLSPVADLTEIIVDLQWLPLLSDQLLESAAVGIKRQRETMGGIKTSCNVLA